MSVDSNIAESGENSTSSIGKAPEDHQKDEGLETEIQTQQTSVDEEVDPGKVKQEADRAEDQLDDIDEEVDDIDDVETALGAENGAAESAVNAIGSTAITSHSSSSKDYHKIYEKYHDKFKKVYAQSIRLFESEKSQRQTLAYYQRKNQALLRVLEEFETANGYKEEPDSVEQIFAGGDRSRLEKIVQQAPHLASSLGPIFQLIAGEEQDVDDEDVDVDEDEPKNSKHIVETPENLILVQKRHYINLYINETVPDLINDDLISIETNPQDPESWTRRHYPNLTTSKFKPVHFPANGLISEYIGNTFPIEFGDGESLVAVTTAASSNGSSGKKKRKSVDDSTSTSKRKK